MATKIKWNEANFKWDDNPHLWNLVEIIEEIISTGTGGIPKKLDTLSDKKKKKFIRLIMQYKGVEIYDEKKEVKNIKAYAKDVELIAEEIKRNVQIIH
tara:strand:+ start:173 stop:466 length:294 start_codon:yes stop_codon:yes gene_type:complete